MSDTTEAMRAALLAEVEAYGKKLDQQGRASGAVILAELLPHLRAAHPTPAAPAVTDSTHTGVVPDAAERYCLSCEKLGHRTDECWSTHGMNTPQARELHRLCVAAAKEVQK